MKPVLAAAAVLAAAIAFAACAPSTTVVHGVSPSVAREAAGARPVVAAGGAKEVIVVDASSSKTRLYIYSVTPDPYPLVQNIAEFQFDQTPTTGDEDGIDNFVDPVDPAHQAQVMPEVLNPLLAAAAKTLRADGVDPATVEVNLLATAGMRRAEQKWAPTHPTAIADFYQIVREGIVAAGFPAGDVRTSDGNAEEGVWSWLNLNDVLVQPFTSDRPTLGVVEVGGSSAQITFPTTAPAGSPHVHDVRFNGRSMRVFSRTYLGLGLDDQRKTMRRDSKAPQACFANGFPAASDIGEAEAGYPKLTEDGAYDRAACQADFARGIAASLAESGAPDVSLSTGAFVGIDGPYYATEFFGVQDSPQQLVAATEKACGAPADQLVVNFPKIAKSDNQQRQCATSTFVDTLLYDPTVGLFRSKPAAFTKAVKVTLPQGGTALTWTRGYLLLKYQTPPAA